MASKLHVTVSFTFELPLPQEHNVSAVTREEYMELIRSEIQEDPSYYIDEGDLDRLKSFNLNPILIRVTPA